MPRPILRTCGTLAALAAALASPAAFGGPLFDAYSAIGTGSWPEAVAIGDVNGDGLNDVVMTTSYYFDEPNDYKLFVFLQDATGALQPPVKYATAASYTNMPKSVAVGDVDGDGLDDVVVGLAGAAIQVFRQENGQLAAPTLIAAPSYSNQIRIGDLNGDGRNDVAGIGWGGAKVGVFTQGLDGVLALSGEYPAPHGGYDDLELGDVNNDGRTDIVVMSGQSYAYNNLAVLTQTTDGKFAPAAAYDLGGNELTRGVGIGDLNGDGLTDVAVSYGGNRPSSQIAVFRQHGAGTLDAAQSRPAYDNPESLEVRDVDGDGLDDILVLHGGWDRMGVYLQNPDGTLAAEELYPIPYATHYNPHGLAIGDINGDGRPDVAIADYNHGLVLLKNVAYANRPPVAALSGPASANRVSPVSFDGSGSSDANGDPLSFEWTIDGSVAGTGTTLTTTFGTLGKHSVSLTVSDGAASATLSKTVSVQNLNPTASAGAAQTVTQKNPVSLSGSAGDQDGTIVSYQWTQLAGPAVVLKGANARTASFTAPSLGKSASATLMFRLQVTDNDGGLASATTTVTVVKR